MKMTLIGARCTKWSINLIELTPDDGFQLYATDNGIIASASISPSANQAPTTIYIIAIELATSKRDKKTRIGHKDSQTFWHLRKEKEKKKHYKFLNRCQCRPAGWNEIEME